MQVDNHTEIGKQSETPGGASSPGPGKGRGLYVAYGIFILLMSGFRLLKESYFDDIPEFETQVAFLSRLYELSCTYLYYPIIGLLISFGLITGKGWAQYGVIAAMITLPITLPLLLMVYGPLYSTGELVFQVLLAILIIVFFVRFPLKHDTGTKFRFKSFAGLLVLAILVLSVRPLFTPLYLKYMTGEPLFITKSKTIVIEPDKYAEEYSSQRKIITASTSFYIPYGYQLFSISAKDTSWRISLLNETVGEKGLILLGNSEGGGSFFNSREYERMGITNGLAFERFMYMNNWNPGAIMLRAMGIRGDYEFSEFTLGENQGFFLVINRKERDMHEFGLYKNGDLLLAGTVGFYGDDSGVGERMAKSIISSAKDSLSAPNAPAFYENGLNSYERGSFEDAQFDFAQAYFQNSRNPEYAYMLVRTLMTNEKVIYKTLREILENSLGANPGHEKLKNMLEEMKAKEKEEG